MIPLGVAFSIGTAGAALYALSFRKRRDLAVPLISNNGKKFIGGALLICAAFVVAYWFLKVRS